MSALVGVMFFMLTVSIVINICFVISRYVRTSNASIIICHIFSIKANSVKHTR